MVTVVIRQTLENVCESRHANSNLQCYRMFLPPHLASLFSFHPSFLVPPLLISATSIVNGLNKVTDGGEGEK